MCLCCVACGRSCLCLVSFRVQMLFAWIPFSTASHNTSWPSNKKVPPWKLLSIAITIDQRSSHFCPLFFPMFWNLREGGDKWYFLVDGYSSPPPSLRSYTTSSTDQSSFHHKLIFQTGPEPIPVSHSLRKAPSDPELMPVFDACIHRPSILARTI